jgi:hypothetical protein
MQIPRRGQMAIFDRSWYGRVLVERVHGLTPIPDWIRAYEEINEFERTLADDGIVMVKFWLHISREEQLRRFITLTLDPETAWQVTAEDWDNHQEYAEYEAAVEDMLANTNTAVAPWAVVPANDMNYKTYLVFKTIIDRLEDALDVERTHWRSLETLEREAAKKRTSTKKTDQKKRKEDKKKKKIEKLNAQEADSRKADEGTEQDVGEDSVNDKTEPILAAMQAGPHIPEAGAIQVATVIQENEEVMEEMIEEDVDNA